MRNGETTRGKRGKRRKEKKSDQRRNERNAKGRDNEREEKQERKEKERDQRKEAGIFTPLYILLFLFPLTFSLRSGLFRKISLSACWHACKKRGREEMGEQGKIETKKVKEQRQRRERRKEKKSARLCLDCFLRHNRTTPRKWTQDEDQKREANA